ncbi:MAG: hypothetical protein IKZ46_05790 [Victivallales bacterium]|nr:hypothetical protein [Victivallales bacterium]
MKKSLTIIILLSLLLPCGLMAVEDTARADEASLSRSSETFAYDVLNVTASDNVEDHDFVFSEEDLRKVGQPTPGIMLSLLMAGGLVRLMLRLRRRVKKNLDLLFESVLSFLLLDESKYALAFYIPFKEICWLKWQRVELRL